MAVLSLSTVAQVIHTKGIFEVLAQPTKLEFLSDIMLLLVESLSLLVIFLLVMSGLCPTPKFLSNFQAANT